MPCIGGPSCPDEPRRNDQGPAPVRRKTADEQINELTRLLCQATRRLGAAGLLTHPDDELRIWHDKHEASDKKRLEKATKELVRNAKDLGYDLDLNLLRDLLK